MKIRTLILAAFLALSSAAFGQQVGPGGWSWGGSISTSGSDCSVATNCLSMPLYQSVGSGTITLSGAFTGTVQFEASGDGGTTWSAISGTVSTGGSVATSATAAGTWQFNLGGYTNIRARASALAAGIVSVSINTTTASGSLNLATSNVPQVFNVKAYGATGDGVTNDYTAIAAAYAAAAAFPGSEVFFPYGTYASGTAIALPTSVSTTCSPNTEILFTGATDGLVWPGSAVETNVFNCQIATSNASAGKALNLNQPSAAIGPIQISGVRVLKTGSGLWAYGIYSDNLQISDIYHFACYQACVVGIHAQHSTSADNFYGTVITGSSGAGSIQRGIEDSDTAPISFNLYGTTFQGYFTKSLINLVGAGPKFYGLHNENTNASPSDGADVVVDSGRNASFSGVQGGSFSVSPTGAYRNFSLTNSEVASVTLGSLSEDAHLSGVRGPVTNNGYNSVVIDNSDTGGNPYPDYFQRTSYLGPNGTALSGTSAGNVTYANVFRGNSHSSLGLEVMYFNGYQNATATAQTITPTSRSWSFTPTFIGSCPSGISATTLTITLPASMGAPFTGQCIAIGY